MGEIKYQEDPKGFFHIYVNQEKSEITVEHYNRVEKEGLQITATGKINKTYTGKKAEKLYREILADDTISQLDHAAYLGLELGKAEFCLNNSLDYVQDSTTLI